MEAPPPVGSSCSKKRAPLSCQAKERASPPNVSVPRPRLEMAHEFWQCCHLLGDAGTEHREEGTEVKQE